MEKFKSSIFHVSYIVLASRVPVTDLLKGLRRCLMNSPLLSAPSRPRLTGALWDSTVGSLMPFLIFGGCQHSSPLLPPPHLPHIWAVGKKTRVLPPLALGGSSDHANLGQCGAKDPSPQPYLLTGMSPSQSALPALPSPFQI